MSTTAIVISNFTGTASFNADGTNKLEGTFNFRRIGLSRPHDGKMDFSADFESDGAVALETWSETSPTSMTQIAGFSGGVTLPSGFNASFDAWSADINMDTVVYSTFDSQWKASKITTGNVTGSCSGVVTIGSPVPIA